LRDGVYCDVCRCATRYVKVLRIEDPTRWRKYGYNAVMRILYKKR